MVIDMEHEQSEFPPNDPVPNPHFVKKGGTAKYAIKFQEKLKGLDPDKLEYKLEYKWMTDHSANAEFQDEKVGELTAKNPSGDEVGITVEVEVNIKGDVPANVQKVKWPLRDTTDSNFGKEIYIVDELKAKVRVYIIKSHAQTPAKDQIGSRWSKAQILTVLPVMRNLWRQNAVELQWQGADVIEVQLLSKNDEIKLKNHIGRMQDPYKNTGHRGDHFKLIYERKKAPEEGEHVVDLINRYAEDDEEIPAMDTENRMNIVVINKLDPTLGISVGPPHPYDPNPDWYGMEGSRPNAVAPGLTGYYRALQTDFIDVDKDQWGYFVRVRAKTKPVGTFIEELYDENTLANVKRNKWADWHNAQFDGVLYPLRDAGTYDYCLIYMADDAFKDPNKEPPNDFDKNKGGQVAAHEAGHYLGLRHNLLNGDILVVEKEYFNPAVNKTQIYNRILSEADIATGQANQWPAGTDYPDRWKQHKGVQTNNYNLMDPMYEKRMSHWTYMQGHWARKDREPPRPSYNDYDPADPIGEEFKGVLRKEEEE